MLLLLEDAGDPRHRMRGFLSVLYPFLPDGFPLDALFELLVYFPLLAAIPLYALYKYYSDVKAVNNVAPYLWVGFMFYGIAALMSASGRLGDWYVVVGESIVPLLGDHVNSIVIGRSLGFFILDSLIEESFELIGASALLSSSIAQYKEYINVE